MAGGVVCLSFCCSQVATLEENRATVLSRVFLMPGFGEQLQHSGSAQSGQPGIALSLYSWKLWQWIAAAPCFQDVQLRILRDQRVLVKNKKGMEREVLQQEICGCCVFGVRLGAVRLDVNLCCDRPNPVFLTVLLQTLLESGIIFIVVAVELFL